MKKYTPRVFLHPLTIKSKNDGDYHYISSMRLAELYGIELSRCYVIMHDVDLKILGKENEDIHLYPSYSGNYEFEKLNNIKTGK